MIRVSIDGIIYARNPGGGIGRYFTETLLQLASEPELDIRCVLPPECPLPARDQGCVRFVNRHRTSRVLDAWRTRPWQDRLFHSSYYTPPARPNQPYIVTVYDFIDHKVPSAAANPGNFFETQCELIKRANSVLTISESTRDDILAHTGIPADRIVVAYPGIASTFHEAATPPSEIDQFRRTAARGRQYWLYVGRRDHYKNFATLFDAFTRIAIGTDTQLVLIGGETRLGASQMEKLISLRCEDRVTLLNGVGDTLLKTAYTGALAFIQPSLAEGFGIPLVEAASCGTPLIVSDIPVFHEVAGPHAAYFDPHDSQSLEQELITILRTPPSAQVLKEARDSVLSRFDWHQTAQQWLSLYRRCEER